MSDAKKFSLGEILTVAKGCPVTDACPVALIEHVTGWHAQSDSDAVARFHVARIALTGQLKWLGKLTVPADKTAYPAFLAAAAKEYGAEHSIKPAAPRSEPSPESVRALYAAGFKYV